jgi:hypothetical protein
MLRQHQHQQQAAAQEKKTEDERGSLLTSSQRSVRPSSWNGEFSESAGDVESERRGCRYR